MNSRKNLAAALGSCFAALSACSVLGGDVGNFELLRGQRFTQAADGDPVAAGTESFAYLARVRSSEDGFVISGSVRKPAGTSDTLELSFQDLALSFARTFATSAGLNAAYPAGAYAFSLAGALDGQIGANVTLGAFNPPAAPKISNLATVSSSNPANSLVISWVVPSGATAGDYQRLVVEDSSGSAVFETPSFFENGAMNGTLNSVSIPGGTLDSEETHVARLTFVKVARRDTSSIPGAVGLIGDFSETQFSIKFGSSGGGGGGGGGTDVIPPALVSSLPADGATGVLTQSPLVLVFSEAMADKVSISWSANVTPQNIQARWGGDRNSLILTAVGGWPLNATVSWTLNPTAGSTDAFQDLAGNRLPPLIFKGVFSTGTAGGGGGGGGGGITNNAPCAAAQAENDRGSVGVFKASNWLQTSAATPVPSTTQAAGFFATVNPPTNSSVSGASVRIPNGTTKTLTNFFGSGYFFFQDFASESTLDSAYPAGSYILTVTGGSGAPSAIALPANGYPPIPHIANFDQVQAINPDADLLLRWDAIPGATTNDFISLTITDSTGTVFQAPDPCIPRQLASSASSIVIPKGTFKSGRAYSGSISFSRMVFRGSSIFPGGSGGGGHSRTTEFGLRTTGGAPVGTGPKFTSILRRENGAVEMILEGTAGATYSVEKSPDLLSWTLLQPVFIPPNGSIPVLDLQAASNVMMYYRARGN